VCFGVVAVKVVKAGDDVVWIRFVDDVGVTNAFVCAIMVPMMMTQR